MSTTLEWPQIRRIDDEAENVSKHVFTKGDAVAEAVLYRYPTYQERTVICCSTQSGCPVGCRFCGAGDAFVRSLTTDEIVEQPVHLLDGLVEQGVDIPAIGRLQIMFMSMGEPLLNIKHLVPALRELHERYPNAALLISTSAPDVNYDDIIEVSREIPTIGLQFSVHESTDEARDALIPFKRKLTLAQIAEKGEAWATATRRRPYFNYCVHDRNDGQADVDRLLELFDPRLWEATLSVICERDESMAVAHQRQRDLTSAFMDKMLTVGYSTRMFDPAGQDTIGGGCGQLWFVQSWFDEHPDLARRSIGSDKPAIHPPAEASA
ncbi:MAG: radical SAM protein [Nocardioidaceae bacterium]|nr:radical SAM protein [Nocardioidaceae bacterium]